MLACWSLLTPGSHSPGLQCSPLRGVHDLEGCRWGRCQALAAHGLLPFPRSGLGGAASCAGGHLAPSGGAAQGQSGNPLLGPCGFLRPSLKVKTRAEGRAPWLMPITRSPGPGRTDGSPLTRVSTGSPGPGRTDGSPLTPECPHRALGPAGQTGAPSPECPHGALGPAGQTGAPHTRVSMQLAESSGTACERVRVSSVAVSVAQGLRGGPGLSLCCPVGDVMSPASHTPGWTRGAGSCGSDRQSPASTQLPSQTLSTDTPSSPASSACLEKHPKHPRGVQGPVGPASSGRWALRASGSTSPAPSSSM